MTPIKKEIVINSTLNEVRIAITEDGKLAEFFIEIPDKERKMGNIYLGKVTKIIQGINAAFIDIGLHQDAFLHFSDIDESLEGFAEDDDVEDVNEPETDDIFDDFELDDDGKLEPESDSSDLALRKTKNKANKDKRQTTFKTKKQGNITINLEPKQNVIVQVTREAYANKGVKVTTRIGLPGRYVVLLPFDNLIGISLKIKNVQERKRLRHLARTALPKGYGCIIRTAAAGKSEDELFRDYGTLLNIWKEIEARVKTLIKPGIVHQDMELARSVIRDLFTEDVKHVYVDSKKLYKDISTYLNINSPALSERVELYNGKLPIFDAFNIEKELEITYKRKVLLPSGGYIIIDQTEAMFVIDVNSGKSMSEHEQEQNAIQTNMEAVKEIAKQIRLRDIAGMAIIDFIDMGHIRNQKKIFYEMKNELARDRAKTVVYPLTRLSLMQITRQRTSQYISEKVTDTCPMCKGSGRITSKAIMLNTLERWLKTFRTSSTEFRLILYVHPQVALYLTDGTISKISRLMIKFFVKIKVQQNDTLAYDQFEFWSVKQGKDITKEFMA